MNRKALDERAGVLLARVGLANLSPRMPVERLGIAQMQLVEIARALSGEGKILVLDEPTATLTPREAEHLFVQVRALKAQGMTLIYVSHHLSEIFKLRDRVTVLRIGAKVGTWRTAETDQPELVRQMIGRTLVAQAPRATAPLRGEALRLEGLRPRGAPSGIDLSLQYGEIVGIAGLVGAGRTELLRAIFGADKPLSGRRREHPSCVDRQPGPTQQRRTSRKSPDRALHPRRP